MLRKTNPSDKPKLQITRNINPIIIFFHFIQNMQTNFTFLEIKQFLCHTPQIHVVSQQSITTVYNLNPISVTNKKAFILNNFLFLSKFDLKNLFNNFHNKE